LQQKDPLPVAWIPSQETRRPEYKLKAQKQDTIFGYVKHAAILSHGGAHSNGKIYSAVPSALARVMAYKGRLRIEARLGVIERMVLI